MGYKDIRSFTRWILKPRRYAGPERILSRPEFRYFGKIGFSTVRLSVFFPS